MARETDELTTAAQQRIAMLGQELGRSGVLPLSEQPSSNRQSFTSPELPAAVVPEPVGRHSRRRSLPLPERASGWFSDRVPSTLRGRISMGHGPLLILAILGLSALLAGWFMFTRSSGSVERIPTAIREKAAQSAPLVSESSTPVSPESGATGIVIDVAGKVRNPGVFTLPLGSRVVDAIEAAGGMRPGAKPGTLNRARVLVDGEQIYVGNPPGGAAAAAVSAPGAPAGGSLVPLNTANQEQLETLPGVGPVTAQSILAWRASHGSFTKIDELLEVDGIGEKTLAKLAPYVTL